MGHRIYIQSIFRDESVLNDRARARRSANFPSPEEALVQREGERMLYIHEINYEIEVGARWREKRDKRKDKVADHITRHGLFIQNPDYRCGGFAGSAFRAK